MQQRAPLVTERRQFGRRPVQWQGEVILPCRAALACTIKNTSRMGALIELDAYVWVPARFHLVIEGRFETACTVQHRTSGCVGVKFDTPMPDLL